MANNYNNFKKFGKLASIIKKIADENPDLKTQIINESTSTSNNFWNKTQNWCSQFLFSKIKEKPLNFFTEKNVEKFLEENTVIKKPSNCFDVFAIPTADLGRVDPFQLEETLRTLPPNLQVQIDLSGGGALTNTGIVKLQDITSIGKGELTNEIRNMYPEIDNVKFVRMRKEGAKENSKKKCDFFIKILFEDDILSPEEELRQVDIGVSLKDLTEKQKKDRIKLKKQLDEEERNKRFKLKSIDKPKKVTDIKVDDEIEKVIQKDILKEFNQAVKRITELQEKGLISKKQFRDSFDKLVKNLRKGGQV